jgi:L-2,4-diaminobutyrate decarboxylase
MSDVEQRWVHSGATPEQVAVDLADLIQFEDDGMSLTDLENMIRQQLEPHFVRYDLPQFHSLFNAFLEPGAALGAEIALEWNQGVTNWQVSPGGAMLEELCCRALCQLFGLADGADGTVMYCGTYANQQALYMALHRSAQEHGFDLGKQGLAGFENPTRLAIVTSVEAHFSLKHAVRFLGLGEQCLVPVGVDSNRRMDTASLRSTVSEIQQSRDVVCVVATSGTTSTGSVDPISEIAEISDELGAWLHVDGAYGLAYKLVPERAQLYTGAERADSVSWDPHKQFGVPIPSSLLFVRRPEDFGRVALFSSYWNRADATEPNPGTKSVPSTRPLTVLPLVASIRHQGLDNLVERLRAPIVAMSDLHEYLEQQPDFATCHVPDTGILCFRAAPAHVSAERLDDLQRHIYSVILAEGRRTTSITEIDGQTALRFVAISPQVTFEAMKGTIEEIRKIAGGFS